MSYLLVSMIAILLYCYIVPVIDSISNYAITYFMVKRAREDVLIEELKIKIEKKHMELEKTKIEFEAELNQSNTGNPIGFFQNEMDVDYLEPEEDLDFDDDGDLIEQQG